MKPEKHLKKIVSRICGGGNLSITSLSLVGVGFSSWVVSGGRENQVSFDVNADGNVIDIGAFLKFNGEPTRTSFCATGFIGSNNGTTTFNETSGQILIPFQLDTGARKISEIIDKSTNEITISTALFSKNSNISNFFSVFSLSNVSLKFSNDDSIYQDSSKANSVNSSNSVQVSNKEWDDTFTINDFPYTKQSYVTFLVSYKISLNEGKKWYENFFSQIKPDQNMKFSFESSIGAN